MKRRPRAGDSQVSAASQPYRVRLPGFLTDDEVGLGDALKRLTYAAGVKPCGGCHERARKLNRWVVFTR